MQMATMRVEKTVPMAMALLFQAMNRVGKDGGKMGRIAGHTRHATVHNLIGKG